ncbi:HAD family hydrolase [Nocardia goodfellowii]
MTALRRLLQTRRCILLDFDGPICSVFAGISDRAATIELAAAIKSPLPDAVAASNDPFDVLRYSATLGESIARVVEAEFTTIELKAVRTARPTPHAHNVIRAAVAKSGVVAVVSNNSSAAVRQYLAEHGIAAMVAGVYGRTTADVAHLKPSPYLLRTALAGLNVHPYECAFIGDSVTDIEAAHAIPIAAIGYANKPGKADRLDSYSPAAVIDSMADVLDALTATDAPA